MYFFIMLFPQNKKSTTITETLPGYFFGCRQVFITLKRTKVLFFVALRTKGEGSF